MKTTARQAYHTAISTKIKHQGRGYGARVVFINNCPDCLGRGSGCGTCGNEPDNQDDKIKIGKYWYERLAAQ